MFIGLFFFFFKQKTAYEMRISDWSSDVCSSDLPAASARRDVESRSAPSKPVATFEPDVEPNADRSDDAEDDEISPLRLQFGHILEIHAVDSGNRGRHREDRGPGGKLTRDRTLALLFEQVTRLAHRDQDVAAAGDRTGRVEGKRG